MVWMSSAESKLMPLTMLTTSRRRYPESIRL